MDEMLLCGSSGHWKDMAAMIMSGWRETSYMPSKASRATAMSFNATP
jgi:hypothetical protein